MLRKKVLESVQASEDRKVKGRLSFSSRGTSRDIIPWTQGSPLPLLGFLAIVLTGFRHVFQEVRNSTLGSPVNEPGWNLATGVIEVTHKNFASLFAVTLNCQALLVLLHPNHTRLLWKLQHRGAPGQDHKDLLPFKVQLSPLPHIDIPPQSRHNIRPASQMGRRKVHKPET